MLLLPGCASNRHTCVFWRATIPDSAFKELAVWQVVGERGWGSALALGGGRFLTCRHVLPAGEGTVQMRAPGEDRGVLWRIVDGRNVLRLEDVPERTVTIIASAGADYVPDDLSTVSADWAVFEVNPCPDLAQCGSPPAMDFDRDMASGDDVLLVGYQWPRSRPLPPGPLVVPLRLLCGQARGVPPLCRFAPRGDVILVDIVGDELDGAGMSGGPAVVWDEDARRLVVVGLCQGAHPCTFLGLPVDIVPTVVRPPARAVADYMPGK